MRLVMMKSVLGFVARGTGVCGWLADALDCKFSGQGFNTWMQQSEGLFFSSFEPTLVYSLTFSGCVYLQVQMSVANYFAG